MYFVENSGIFFGKKGFAGYEAMIPTRDYLFPAYKNSNDARMPMPMNAKQHNASASCSNSFRFSPFRLHCKPSHDAE
ncbi:hypothetical protein VTJ04DRAFT_6447 [Mycothermus thermophilus]|uniref:uncharacterized protein n=1 Tax=Humicola insolens TaxID=85995 RepID=UPI0037445EB5